MNAHLMNIKFVKVERDCRENQMVRDDNKAGISTRKIIYDYSVIEDGKITAMFCLWLQGRRGYCLCDMKGRPIKEEYNASKCKFGSTIKANTKNNFEAVYIQAKKDGLIPTREQVDQMDIDEKNKEEQLAAQQTEQQHIRKIQDQGVTLFNIAESLSKGYRKISDELALEFTPAQIKIIKEQLESATVKFETLRALKGI